MAKVGRKQVRLEVIHGSREYRGEEAKAVLIEVSRGMRERQDWEAQLRALSRRPRRDESEAIRAAMRAVEHRIVKGLWVLEISQSSDGPQAQRQHGMGYSHEHSDVDARYTDAAGGKWTAPPPRPAVPSPKEISAANEAIGWTETLDEDLARLVRVAALTKRGDRARRVNWDWVKIRLNLPDSTPLRTLRDRYDSGLRRIVAELTLAKIA